MYAREEGGYGLASRIAQAKVTAEARLSPNLCFGWEPSIIKLFLAEAAIELGPPRKGVRVAELVKAQSSVAQVTVRQMHGAYMTR